MSSENSPDPRHTSRMRRVAAAVAAAFTTSRIRLAVAAATTIGTAAVLSFFRQPIAGFVRAVESAIAVLMHIAGSVPGGVYWTLSIGVSIAIAIRLLAAATQAAPEAAHLGARPSDSPVEPPAYPPSPDPFETGNVRDQRFGTEAGWDDLFTESVDAARHGSRLGDRIDRRVAEIVARLYGYSTWNREAGEAIASRPEIASLPNLRAAVDRGGTRSTSPERHEYRVQPWYFRAFAPRKAAKQREARARAEEHRLKTLITELETLEQL